MSAPKSGVYSNCSARAHILLLKTGRGKQARYRTITVAPGEQFTLDQDDAAMFEKTPAFSTGEIKRGNHALPPPRKISLDRVDLDTGLRIISSEADRGRLRDWIKNASPTLQLAAKTRLAELDALEKETK